MTVTHHLISAPNTTYCLRAPQSARAVTRRCIGGVVTTRSHRVSRTLLQDTYESHVPGSGRLCARGASHTDIDGATESVVMTAHAATPCHIVCVIDDGYAFGVTQDIGPTLT